MAQKAEVFQTAGPGLLVGHEISLADDKHNLGGRKKGNRME